MSNPKPICLDTEGACFARSKAGKCNALLECSERCRFKKAIKTKTNGKDYPINPLYVGMNDSSGREMTGKTWREAHGNTV